MTDCAAAKAPLRVRRCKIRFLFSAYIMLCAVVILLFISLSVNVLQVAKFNGVHAIDLYFPSNFGADATEILYIGFKVRAHDSITMCSAVAVLVLPAAPSATRRASRFDGSLFVICNPICAQVVENIAFDGIANDAICWLPH